MKNLQLKIYEEKETGELFVEIPITTREKCEKCGKRFENLDIVFFQRDSSENFFYKCKECTSPYLYARPKIYVRDIEKEL